MRRPLLFSLLLVVVAAQLRAAEIPIPSTAIASIEATASVVTVSFAPDAQTDALAQDRRLSTHVAFPFPAVKSLFISEVRFVAHRLAAVSFTLPSADDAREFARAMRDGRVQLRTHPKV